MNSLISVIVPVYNVSPFVEKCIKSIVEQNYKELEIIIVDDGSTDDSVKKCEKVQKNDNRIKIIKKKNGGLSDARNVGLKVANGEYVTFVDSDDYISPKLVSLLYKNIKKTNSQISVCDPVHVFNNKKYEFKDETEVKEYNSLDAIEEMLYQTSFLVSAWGKMYRRELFSGIEFPVGKLFEDSAIMYKLFEKADKVVYSNAKYYVYVHRENSITTKAFSNRDLDILSITKEIEQHYSSNPILAKAAISYRLAACFRVLLNAPKTKEFKNAENECGEYIKKHGKDILFNSKVRKKERLATLLYMYFRPITNMIYRRINRWK